MPENSKENLKKQIKLYKFNDIPWIAELWALSEIVTLEYAKELSRFSIHIDEFRLVTFSKSFQIIYGDLTKYLWYVYFNDEEMSKLKGIESLMRVKETHLRIKRVSKVIRNAIGSLLFSAIRNELKDVDLKYQIEFAKKEWMPESNEQVYPIQNKKYIAIQKKNVSDLKTFNDLHDIIDQIKKGARTVAKVAANLGVARSTIHRRLNAANKSFQWLLSSVSSVA